MSLGPLPKADQFVFKALQTYTDGEVVRWIEEPTGGAEPEGRGGAGGAGGAAGLVLALLAYRKAASRPAA